MENACRGRAVQPSPAFPIPFRAAGVRQRAGFGLRTSPRTSASPAKPTAASGHAAPAPDGLGMKM
eukprot:scaffold23402_cov125-Isochrysis_galbana.AAC.7